MERRKTLTLTLLLWRQRDRPVVPMGCRSEDFNDEDGKLGDDGRKRRSWGSSDDEGPLTHDNLHNEDLRVGGPYLCSIPTASVVVPKNHVKFRLTCLETDGWELGQKILNIIDKYHLNQRGIGVMFSFFGRQSIFAASGFKHKDPGLTKDGKNYPTNLDWALVSLIPARQPSNMFFHQVPRIIPENFAPRSIIQSLEVHGDEVFMHRYRSRERIGLYNGLRVANIEAKMKEGVVTTAITLDYSVTGLEGENFSARGDSGAMVSHKRRTSTGNESVIIGMVIAGFEKEGITSFTRADFSLDDIKEMTKARDIELELFWSS